MAHVSSGSFDPHSAIDAHTTTTPAGNTETAQNITTPTAAQVSGDALLRARGSSHPDLTARTAPLHHHDYTMRQESLTRLEGLFGKPDDMSGTGRRQDQQLAIDIQIASQVALPSTTRSNDCVVLPPDVMAYWVRHGDQKKMLYTCPEINGTGFGGIGTMPPRQFGVVMETYRQVAADIKRECDQNGESPLMIVANSGREGAERSNGSYPPNSNSKMIWEKAHIADICAREFGTDAHPCLPSSLDEVITAFHAEVDAAKAQHQDDPAAFAEARAAAHARASEAMKQFDGQPLVLLGYSRDLAECADIRDGRAFLFGRAINGIVNDRAIENLNMTQGEKLDFRKLALINSTVDEGVNKFSAALARAEFAQSEEAKALPNIAQARGFEYDVMGLDKAFHYTSQDDKGDIEGLSELDRFAHYSTFFRGIEENEGLDGVARAYDDFKALGFDIRPLFKPNGTGQAKGIIGVRDGESKAEFLDRFEQNLKQLEKNFGKGAGYPFEVVPLLELARTAEGENYDLRFTIFQNPKTPFYTGGSYGPKIQKAIQTVPLLLKKEPASESSRTGPLEFSPTNITAAVAKTGRPAVDFIIPLCSKEGMEQSGLDEKQLKSMALYFSAFQSWLLKNKYSREEASDSSSVFSSDSSSLEPTNTGADPLGRSFPDATVATDSIGRTFHNVMI